MPLANLSTFEIKNETFHLKNTFNIISPYLYEKKMMIAGKSAATDIPYIAIWVCSWTIRLFTSMHVVKFVHSLMLPGLTYHWPDGKQSFSAFSK